MGIVAERTEDDLAYLIWRLRTFRLPLNLNLLNLPNLSGSSLNHEGIHESYQAVSPLSHFYPLIDPNTQARSIGHHT